MTDRDVRSAGDLTDRSVHPAGLPREREIGRRGYSIRQTALAIWLMPVVAMGTAAIGSYVGVIRAIADLRAETRIVRVECRALERRVGAIEEEIVRDLAAARGDIERDTRLQMERHERAYHEGRER